MQPFEILAGPLDIYTGPVGESQPAIEDTPAGNWNKLATSGQDNYTEDGVSVSLLQTIDMVRVLGETGPVKALRSAEDLIIMVTMMDLTLEEFSIAMNGNTVTDVAAGGGAAGYRHVGNYRGLEVTRYALLVRGKSPYDDINWNLQFEVPVAVVTGSPNPIWRKNEPAGLEMEFTALVDPSAASDAVKFGRLVAQDANVV